MSHTPTDTPLSDIGEGGTPSPIVRGALFALLVLFSMNLLNYVDRYVFAAVGVGIQRDLSLTKERFGILSSSFMVVYTLVAPIVGWLNDRMDRRKLLAFGVGLWSFATVGTAFSQSFNQMFWARAFLGVGEASYGVVAPTLLAEFFDVKRRGRVMAIFYLALPVGTAIGYGVGGFMQKLGSVHAEAIHDAAARAGIASLSPYMIDWRLAFWVVGLPGFLLALLGLAIREPRHARGVRESSFLEPPTALPATEAGPTASPTHVREQRLRKAPSIRDYLQVIATPSYVFNTIGLAAITFTTGAFGNWFPTYFEEVHHTRPEDKIYLGLGLALAGLLGVLLSMWLPERLKKRTRRAYMLWCGVAVLIAVPLGALGLLASSTWVALGLLTIASIFMSSCLGPSTTVTADVVPVNRRGVGFALSIFLLHLFGDIPSPPLVGWVADRLGSDAGRASALGRLVESLGALPITDAKGHTANLTAGLLLIVPVMLIGCLSFLIGSKFLPRDQDRAKAANEAAGADESAGLPLH